MEQGELTRRQLLRVSGTVGLAGLAAVVPTAAESRAASYKERVLAKKPVGYWRLGDDGLKTAADSSGHKRDGKYHGAPKSTPGALRSDADAAVALDGKSYVEIPDHAAFSQPTSGAGLTVEVWVRPDALEFDGVSADPYVMWLGKGEKDKEEWALRFYSKKSKRPNRISAYLFNPSGGLGAGAYFEDALTRGEWIHVVGCFDPGDADSKGKPGVTLYKNGKRRSGPPSPGTLYNNPQWQIKPAHGTAPLRLGTRDKKSFLTGALDEVAVYPRVLTADEILENYNAGQGK